MISCLFRVHTHSLTYCSSTLANLECPPPSFLDPFHSPSPLPPSCSYGIVLQKGYQRTAPVQGTVTNKVKGASFYNGDTTFMQNCMIDLNQTWSVYDTSDYVIPPQVGVALQGMEGGAGVEILTTPPSLSLWGRASLLFLLTPSSPPLLLLLLLLPSSSFPPPPPPPPPDPPPPPPPLQEPNSFFIMTNMWITCNQHYGVCPEVSQSCTQTPGSETGGGGGGGCMGLGHI